MIRRLYDWAMDMARHERAPHLLFWVSFIESSVFPIPPDVMLIPMILARRAKAWVYASIATIGSVLGGILGYAIGYFLFEYLGRPILEVVEADAPVRLWGITFTTTDIDTAAELLGDKLGRVKYAVQPGRRIATVRKEAGLGLPVALISPKR